MNQNQLSLSTGDRNVQSQAQDLTGLPSVTVIFASVEQELRQLREFSDSLVFDYASARGEKEARSHVHSLRLIKGRADRARKEATQGARDYQASVNEAGKAIEDELNQMIDVHMEPLLLKEEQEKARKEALELKVQAISNLFNSEMSSVEAKQALLTVQSIIVDASFQERIIDARRVHTEVITKLQAHIPLAQAKEFQIAEEARIKADLAVKQERERIEQERAEQARIEAQKAQDVEHRRTINRNALNALIGKVPLSEKLARDVLECIIKGEIPNVALSY